MNLTSFKKEFSGKRITMLGLGLLGRGVGDAIFLAKCRARLTITDKKSRKELKPSLAKLSRFKNIKYVLGKHRLQDFQKADLIIKAAGVALDSPFIAEAKKHGIPVYMTTALFAKLAKGVKIIGVTGTRGKTTTTHLIYEILRSSGQRVFLGLNRSPRTVGRKIRFQRIFLGGNIQGVSTLALLTKVRPGDIVVLELDSWQLQGFGDLRLSPHISVFTTFLDDHLNYYKGNRRAYFADKAHIFRYQTAEDFLIVGEQASLFVRKARPLAEIIEASGRSLPSSWLINLLGRHNRNNIACAIAVARALKVPETIIKDTIANFKAVSGRLELARIWRGIKIYNDTTATTPDATIAALRAVNSPGRIVLIIGGSDKGLDLSELARELPKYCKATVLLSGSGTKKLTNLPTYKLINPMTTEVATLKEALEVALKVSQRGDIILFSPSFASFGLFKNEYDRGSQFIKLVKKIQE